MLKIKLDSLKTGDILLFSAELTFNPISWFAKLIEIFTKSPYSHVGMILRDPIWISSEMKGLYLWESSYEGTPDPQDGKIKLGVEITPMEQILKKTYDSKIWYRKINCPNDKLTVFNLMKTHSEVYDKPYDFHPGDWIEAYIRKKGIPTTERYFCSAFVGFVYTTCNILSKDTDWSIIRPSDFADEKYLNFEQQCFLSKLEKLK